MSTQNEIYWLLHQNIKSWNVIEDGLSIRTEELEIPPVQGIELLWIQETGGSGRPIKTL